MLCANKNYWYVGTYRLTKIHDYFTKLLGRFLGHLQLLNENLFQNTIKILVVDNEDKNPTYYRLTAIQGYKEVMFSWKLI